MRMLEVLIFPIIILANSKDIGSRLSYIKYYNKYHDNNVLLVAYRGYSYSEGIPSEQGLCYDGTVKFLSKK